MASSVGGCTLNSSADLRRPWVQLFAPSSPIALSMEAQELRAGGSLNWHFQNVTTAACVKEVKEGRLKDDSEQATFREK